MEKTVAKRLILNLKTNNLINFSQADYLNQIAMHKFINKICQISMSRISNIENKG